MERKEDVLQHLEEIHSTLVESERFMPYNFKAFVMWGIISIILFGFAHKVFEMSLLGGGIFLVVVLSFGAVVEYILTKKENKKYEMQELSKIQKFIESVFALHVIFGILLSIVLVQAMLVEYIYLIWVFLIGSAGYIAGFTINSKLFLDHGKISILGSIVLFLLSFMYDMTLLNQLFAIFMIGVGYIYLGIELKKECKSV